MLRRISLCLPASPPVNAVRALAATAALACAISAAPPAACAEAAGGVLSPRLAELAKPSVRNAPPAKQAHELGVAEEGPGSLLRSGSRVVLDVRFAHGAAAGADALGATGAEVEHVSRRYQTVAIATMPAELRSLSAIPGVVSAKEVLTPFTAGVGGPATASAGASCFGAATSEGDQQLRAAEARQIFGVDGSGVTVGILSDSFDRNGEATTDAAGDVASGDLPGPSTPCGSKTPVNLVDDSEEGEDEGRAMAQIVHDLAPGAAIAFATAFAPDVFGFAANIDKLAETGADVMVDDVFYFEEPFFQEGPVAVAVSEAVEGGAAYFSAAGNDNLIEEPEPGVENDIASWEASEFRDSEACPQSIVELSEESEFIEETEEPELPPEGLHPQHCMDFNPGAGVEEVDRTFGITVEPGETLVVDLQWAEPWYGVGTDLDAFLLDESGEVVGGEIEDNIGGSQMPLEVFAWENESAADETVRLAINRFSGGLPPLKFALLENGGGVSETEYPESAGGDTVGPTIFGHGGAEDAVSVGAIPYFGKSAPESYSSRGPVTHYFKPVIGTEAAEALSSKQTLAKPDLVATDGGANTFFGFCENHAWRFYGTSAAAPHAAAVAALELDAKPSATVEEVVDAQTAAAKPVGVFSADAVGSGLVDAAGAVSAVQGLSPEVALEPAPGPSAPPPDCAGKPGFKEIEEKIIAASPPAATTPPPTRGRIPDTFFHRHPPHLIRTAGRAATAVFRFGSHQAGVTFLCRIDGGPVRACPERFVRRYGIGAHVVRVMARGANGRVDSTAAVFHFRVERRG